MTTSIVKPLADVRATDVTFSGGKGANLGELRAAGLPVPDAFVIGVPAYQEGPGAGRPPSGEVRDAIVANYQAMGRDVAVAVRSSAANEDSSTASHAGLYETVLNVQGTTGLLDAVTHCWTSASSSPSRRYRAARGMTSDDAGIAVVVQRQIASAWAGVAFTEDPLTGRPDQVVIESAIGPGDAVAAGRVTPDRVIVDKHSLDIVAGESLSRRSAATLSRNQFREIAEYAVRIEQWYGRPQDIEWAVDQQGRAWILQARPITTFDALEARANAVALYDPPRPPDSRWTRANIGEALPGVPTPLTWSIWSVGLNKGHWQSQIQLGVAPKRDEGCAPVVALAQGWPALSVDLLESQVAMIPGMDVSAFSRQFFGDAEPAAPASVHTRAVTAMRMATHAPITLALLRRRLRTVSAVSRRSWQRDAWRPAADPAALLVEAASRFHQTMSVHVMQTNVCQSLYQAVERFTGGLAVDLLSADGDLPEARLATDLWLLGRGETSLDRFLREHGFHGPDEGELASPSWRQNPEPVLHAARVCARDPGAALDRRRHERRTAQAALCASLPRPRRPAVLRLLAMARRAVVAREIGKAAFLQDLDVARHAMSFLGEDAVWRTLEELQADVRLTAVDIIARQRIRSQFAAQEPPLSFVGDPDERPPLAAEYTQSVITGVGVSPGRAHGRARVVTDPAAAVALGAEDVLIARTTDPSWVTTFMTVAGMALDVGATLSHAAIIARELGIPCVIGTGSGTQLIPDGALVEVDGSRGTVRILDSPA